MRSSSYHSRYFSNHSPSLHASTGSAAVPSPAFTHHHTAPLHQFNHPEQERVQNELQYGSQSQYRHNSHYHSHSTTAQTSSQHVYAAITQQAPDEPFLSKSPYSNVEQAGKDILRSARQKLDARRKARPISVEQKTSSTLIPNALVMKSPSVGDIKRQLWSDDEKLQSSPVTKLHHSTATQPPTQHADQNSIQTSESASLSLRSYRSLSPSRVHTNVMDRSYDSVDAKSTTQTTPTTSTDSGRGRGGPLFHSKYYAAARAARLRDQKEQEQQRSRSSSIPAVSLGKESASKLPTRQPSPPRSHAPRSRSLSRSFSSTNKNGASEQQETAPAHQNSHLGSNSKRSRSLSRSFPPTKESISSTCAKQHATITSRQASTSLRTSPLRARYISRSFSSTNETAASTRTVDSKQHANNIPTRHTSPLPTSQRNSHSMPPRKKSEQAKVAKVPSSPQTHMSSNSPRSASSSSTTEKEHRLKGSSPNGTSILARGRLANMALEKGLANRNGRSRSPFIEKRMRSFSRDREQNELKLSPEQRPQQTVEQQHFVEAGQGASDRTQPLQTYGASSSMQGAEKTTKPKVASARGERSSIAAFWNGKINRVTSSPRGSTESPQKRPTRQKEEKEKEINSTESKPSSLDLMAKLNAVDRQNPAQALAQIDFILREEGRMNSFEPILINPNVGNDDDSAGTTISSLTNPDYRDWQIQQQMRANQNVPNQIAPTTAVSSFRRPRPSHLQNYNPNSFSKEKSNPLFTNHQKQPQPVATTTLEKQKAKQMAKLANTSREAKTIIYSTTVNQETTLQDSTSSPLPRPSSLPTQRSHPWDGDAPDTESIPVSVPPIEERVATIDAHTEFKRQEQTMRSRSTVPAKTPRVETNSGSSGLADNDFNINAKTGDLTAKQSNKKVSTPRITPQQYANSRKISDNFDTAWALMPDSGFAPVGSPKGRQGRGSQSSRTSRTLDLNTSFDASSNATRSYHSRSLSIPEDGDSEGVNGERFSIEVSLYNPDPNTPNKGGSKPKSRKRGFLRSLVRRQNGKKGTTSSTNSESQNSTGMYSGSQSSSAAQSRSAPGSMNSGRSSSVVSPPSIRNESRQRSRSTAPSKPSSPAPSQTAQSDGSIDGFRTASMAKKYSRVMRLYDDD
ncbi:unnamed protein product [Cylindrotheca closterium]|uniref:Uncharacterized protein n=1 Tax=Cylindrotheca closterium TaxID=2856 RepID=A0AAD2FZW9_9STRA|nr:unnamed protein product [Cylindrotheca closterium]